MPEDEETVVEELDDEEEGHDDDPGRPYPETADEPPPGSG